MDFLNDGRTRLALIGAVIALLAGLAIAWAMVSRHRGETAPPPPASQAGLVIDPSGAATAKVDATRSLRCFVAGQYVGDLALADCAKASKGAAWAMRERTRSSKLWWAASYARFNAVSKATSSADP